MISEYMMNVLLYVEVLWSGSWLLRSAFRGVTPSLYNESVRTLRWPIKSSDPAIGRLYRFIPNVLL